MYPASVIPRHGPVGNCIGHSRNHRVNWPPSNSKLGLPTPPVLPLTRGPPLLPTCQLPPHDGTVLAPAFRRPPAPLPLWWPSKEPSALLPRCHPIPTLGFDAQQCVPGQYFNWGHNESIRRCTASNISASVAVLRDFSAERTLFDLFIGIPRPGREKI